MIEEFISRSLILALGYAYPAFLCFKTLEKNRVAIQELRFWCQYWTIAAVLTVIEKFSDIFISWLPMYRGMKLALFIYLWHPKTKGSDHVYETLLRPYLLRYETEIDRSLFEAKETVLNLAFYYWHDCTELGSKWVLQFFQSVVTQSASIRPPTSQLQNAGNQQSKGAPPPTTPPSTPSAILERNISDKRRPPVPPLGSYNPHLNQTPKSESMIVRLLSPTQFIHTDDVLIRDLEIGFKLEEKTDVEHVEGDKIKIH